MLMNEEKKVLSTILLNFTNEIWSGLWLLFECCCAPAGAITAIYLDWTFTQLIRRVYLFIS